MSIDDGKWAGLGVQLGSQQTAGDSVGDAKTPAAGSVSGTPDRYYERDVRGGCPSCGSYLYDSAKPLAPIPPLQ